MVKLCQRRFRLDIREKFLRWRGQQALEEAAQGGGGFTILGVFKKCVDVELGGFFSGEWGGAGLMV